MRIIPLVWSALLTPLMSSGLLPAARAERPAPALQDSAVRGEVVFRNWCVECHGAGGGHPGTTALQTKYHGSVPALLEERTDLNATTVKFYVRHGISIMPMFRKTEISDADLDELAAYLSKGQN